MVMVNNYDVVIQYLFHHKRFGQSLCFINVIPENRKSDVTLIKSRSK